MKVSFDAARHSSPQARKAGWYAMRLYEFLHDLSALHGLNGRIPPRFQDPDYIASAWGLLDPRPSENSVTEWLSLLIEAGLIERLPGNDASVFLTNWEESLVGLKPEKKVKPSGDGPRLIKSPDGEPELVEFGLARLKKFWNSSIPPEVKGIYKLSGGKREVLATARLQEHGPDDWKRIVDEIWACPFLRGDNDRKWVIDFDFVVRPGSIAKLFEGKYRGIGEKERKQAKSDLVGSVLADGKDLYG